MIHYHGTPITPDASAVVFLKCLVRALIRKLVAERTSGYLMDEDGRPTELSYARREFAALQSFGIDKATWSEK